MSDCLFCNMVKGKIPCSIVYEDEKVLAFHDINPAAPIHILIIPKRHIESVQSLHSDNADLIGDIFLAASKIAKEMGIDKTGYRIVTNVGEAAGQTVKHIHYHLLGGRTLLWPPG